MLSPMEQIAECLKGLSDPTRLRIIALLDHGELCICDLMESLELPQSKVSRHMSYLKNGGWVTSERKGKWVYYSLGSPDSPLLREAIVSLRKHLPETSEGRDDHARLVAYLKTKSADSCSAKAQ